MRNDRNNELGITLITLVVTIIVMLILAGVSISLAVNQGGLFAQAKNSTDKYGQYAQNNINDMNALLDILGDDNGESIDTIMELPPAPTYDSYEIKSVTDGSFNLYIYGVTPGSEDAEINFVNFNIWVDENKANKITKTATKHSNGTTFWLKINVDDLEGVVGTYNVKVDIEDTNGGSASINGISQAFTSVAELEGKEYATVSAALAKVPTDSATHTVNLLRNANCSFSSVANTDAILDLKTYTLNLASFTTNLHGDSLYIKNGIINATNSYIYNSNGITTMDSITLNNVSASYSSGIINENNTKTTFKDTTLNNDGSGNLGITAWQTDGSEIIFEGTTTLNKVRINSSNSGSVNSTITFKDNVTATNSLVYLGKSSTCIMNNYTTFNGDTNISNYGSLTLNNNVSLSNTNYLNPCIFNCGGILNINDSTYIDSYKCINTQDGGEVTINSGSLTNTTSRTGGTPLNNYGSTINIKGGSISNDTNDTILNSSGTLNISNGTLSNSSSSYSVIRNQSRAIVNISGGIIKNTSTGYSIYNYADKSNVTKTGGTVTGTTYNCNF